MKRSIAALAVICVVLLCARASRAGYFVSEVSEFVGGHLTASVNTAPAYKGSLCAFHTSNDNQGSGPNYGNWYNQVCAQVEKWSVIGGHKASDDATMIEHWGRQVRDVATNGCIADTTTVYRYRLTTSPANGNSCTGNSESLSDTIVFSRSTCANNNDTRDDGEGFKFTFANDNPPTQSNTQRYYHTLTYVSIGGGSLTGQQDACYSIWWHP